MKKRLAFYIPYCLFVLTLVVLLVNNEKAGLHLWLTSFHTPAGDTFFKYYTEVGGWVPFLIFAIALFIRYRAVILILVAQLAAGLITQIAKFIWNAPRPKVFFEQNFPQMELHRISGVNLHSSYSFPSGHTTSAFALFLALAILSKNRTWQFMCFVLAALVGYSRIYLSQHFALDVLVGSLIGVIMTELSRRYMRIYHQKWAEGSLRDVFLKKREAKL